MITVQNSVPNPVVEEAVLFPFDSYSCPFSAGLRLQLIPGKIPGRANPIVVGAGEPGAADDFCTRFYGTVIPIDGVLRMWYLAKSTLDADGRNGGQLRCCYATSTDGIHWDKPDLGLIEFNGSTHNNIVNLRAGRCDFAALPVMYEPDDPDPSRRFKCVFESEAYGNQFAVAYSADGLDWTESPNNPVGPGLEQTGLIRHNGCYFVNGQGGSHYTTGRALATFASYDFETWTQASCLGHRRDMVPPHPLLYDPLSSAPKAKWNQSEEVHLGAGLWDRGNVILGIYDIWHGTPSSDRQLISMDLGFLVSHDALHFEEPIKDFPILPAYEETGAVVGKPPTVSHGQGMVNWGDQTLMWYEAWGNLPVEVRLATWERDRIGYFEAMRGDGGHLVTCPLAGATEFSANVGGLGPYTELRFELLDEGFHPLPGFSGADAAVLTELEGAGEGEEDLVPGQESQRDAAPVAGLREPIRWQRPVPTDAGPLRLQVSFAGVRPEDARLYAIYAR